MTENYRLIPNYPYHFETDGIMRQAIQGVEVLTRWKASDSFTDLASHGAGIMWEVFHRITRSYDPANPKFFDIRISFTTIRVLSGSTAPTEPTWAEKTVGPVIGIKFDYAANAAFEERGTGRRSKSFLADWRNFDNWLTRVATLIKMDVDPDEV
ncbi:MAG: hypothetical protein K0S42_3225 [Microvirga sp.]|nr:hypothetical protein [Microvirga sp.]